MMCQYVGCSEDATHECWTYGYVVNCLKHSSECCAPLFETLVKNALNSAPLPLSLGN